MWKDKLQAAIQQQFELTKKKNPRYSVRAFANKLGISVGSTSAILTEKTAWNPSVAKGEKVLMNLKLNPRETDRLRVLMGLKSLSLRKSFQTSEYPLLLDWTYFSILFCFDLSVEERTTSAIAKRFGLKIAKVNDVVQDLKGRGYLVEVEGQLERNPDYFETSDDIPSAVLSQFHKMNIEMSLRALERIETPARDITSTIFVGSKRRMTEIKAEIRRFHQKIISLAETKENDEVYRLNIGLFPTRSLGEAND